ncbi:MAG: UDP-N-acetylglucosamine 1-carboxyvinyltransferase [Candidatus Dependentiae bacterium]|nr:UDP-N-acetylglucosamine 1-carboxyvinyltransferase [Candidatus Dependentiae bacterium]
MSNAHIIVEQSLGLQGQADLVGAKNAVLVIIASLILTRGKSTLTNVPSSDDVLHMIALLQDLGAEVEFIPQSHVLHVDTTGIHKYKVKYDIMKKMRASILVMGPLLARFGKADVALPGGCVLGARPIDYHLKNFTKMGVTIDMQEHAISAYAAKIVPTKLVLDYPSVGATENLMMAATLTDGVTRIVNAALEPEVLDLVDVLRKMGAHINILPPATIEIIGVTSLHAVEHAIIHDRLEAGTLLLATAITGGEIYLPQASEATLEMVLMKLQEMGHSITVGEQGKGVRLKSCASPRAVSFKTAPYPGFPTDLQAPMMALQCLADGTSIIEETVFENRLLHVRELSKMGAQIKVEHNTAIVTGIEALYGTNVIATDIRASCSLVMAGMVAQGVTVMTGIHHWQRGYEALEKKLQALGANIRLNGADDAIVPDAHEMSRLKKAGISSQFLR